jgi:hypothetical protein
MITNLLVGFFVFSTNVQFLGSSQPNVKEKLVLDKNKKRIGIAFTH